jgi:transcriptional regulator with XRE-family HTH domain
MPSPRQRSQQNRAVELGQRLRRRRRELGLTQRQVAEQVPMSAANLSRIENGDQGPPSDEMIEQLSRALTLPTEELLAVVGRSQTFEQRVLEELRDMRREMRRGFDRLERAIGER